MKKSLVIVCLAFLIQANAAAQSCLPEGIFFYTQEEIDNFPTNYPGCTEIEGYVQLYGFGTFNLDSLSVLSSIGGWFAIEGLPNLTDLNGLNNLISIGGSLYIGNNDSLTSIAALSNLTSINNDLTIASNPLLTNLNGLENLVSIGSNYYGESLTIYDNDVLNSLSGIENINADSIVNLTILSNPLLSYCETENICEYLLSPNGSVIIAYNSENCNSPVAIATACGNSLACLPYGDYIFTNQAEIDSFSVNFPDCNDLEGFLSIQGEDIINLNGLSQITSINKRLVISASPLLTYLSGLENLISIGSGIDDGLYILQNESLENLSGLNNLITINGDFNIQYNNELLNFSGLESLTNITQDFIIFNNPSLSNLTGINNLLQIDGDFIITSNSSLSSCATEVVCSLINSGDTPLFNNNSTGCNSATEVQDACDAVGISENEKNHSLSIFPNPASTSLTIIYEGEIEKLTLYSANGQGIYSQNSELLSPIQLNICDLENGIYIIEILTKRDKQHLKFVKE